MQRVILCIIFLLFFFSCRNLSGEVLNDDDKALQLSSKELIEKYRVYLLSYHNIEITEKLDTVVSYPDKEMPGLKLMSTFFLTKDKIKYEIQEYNNVDRSKESLGEILLKNDKELFSSFSLNDDRLSVFEKKAEATQKFCWLGKNIYAKLFLGIDFFGVYNPNEIESIFDILSRSQCNLTITNPDSSSEFILLEAKCNTFTVKFWFNTKYNGPPYKIIFERSPETLHYDEVGYFLLEVKDFQVVEDIYIPREMIIIYDDYAAKNLSVKKMIIKDGKPIDPYQPEKLNLNNALRRRVTQTVVWDKVKLHKTFSDSVFKHEKLFVIPNGTPVAVLDAPQIEYVWMDGKPVVKTDEVALRIARGDYGFMPGPKNPRFWFIAFGLVLLLVGGGLKIRSMLKKEG